ncbi:MAG: ATP-binding protein [Phaeospirillum sp.]|nr:ATP-binding protein [Phaeospirillum sp.]
MDTVGTLPLWGAMFGGGLGLLPAALMGWAVRDANSSGTLAAIGLVTVLMGCGLGLMAGRAFRHRLKAAAAARAGRLEDIYEDAVQRARALLSNAERVAQLGSSERQLETGQSAWSDGFFAILGLDPEQCQPSSTRFLDCVHPADRAAIEAVMAKAVQEGRRVEEYFRIIRPDGEIRILHGRAEVGRDEQGKAVRLDSIIQDVTERKRLEDELDGLIRELWRSNEELEQFAYVASHDLRQPLRVVGSYVSLMEEELQGSLNDDTQEYMTFVRDGVRRMDRLITDLLTYSRVGRTSTDQLVSMAKAAESAVTDLQFEIEDAGATIHATGDPPMVMGDQSEMERLFQNLIGNAIKYRRPNQPPEVMIHYEDQGDAWRISVSDNGIGIPPEHAERVFGIFQRLHARNEFEGTGVGLAIAKKIVERHGGVIKVEPRETNDGTTLTFSWPKMRAPVDAS